MPIGKNGELDKALDQLRKDITSNLKGQLTDTKVKNMLKPVHAGIAKAYNADVNAIKNSLKHGEANKFEKNLKLTIKELIKVQSTNKFTPNSYEILKNCLLFFNDLCAEFNRKGNFVTQGVKDVKEVKEVAKQLRKLGYCFSLLDEIYCLTSHFSCLLQSPLKNLEPGCDIVKEISKFTLTKDSCADYFMVLSTHSFATECLNHFYNMINKGSDRCKSLIIILKKNSKYLKSNDIEFVVTGCEKIADGVENLSKKKK